MDKTMVQMVSVFSAAFCLGIAGVAAASAQGRATAAALDAVARQPEAKSSITQMLIVGLAIIESIALYALLIAIVLIFVNPFAR
ncbi:MAG: ATP F0F1 synthase subunit C [Candidatus Margulisiibacteriota bacterium]